MLISVHVFLFYLIFIYFLFAIFQTAKQLMERQEILDALFKRIARET